MWKTNNKKSLLLLSFTLASFYLIESNLSTKDSLPPSSPRKSINYGPNYDHSTDSIKLSIYNNNNNNDLLIKFNDNLSTNTLSSLVGNKNDKRSIKSFGIDLAKQFLRHLHPNLNFQITSAHISKHTNVLHAYFVQTIQSADQLQIKVHNALANLNIDLDPKSNQFGQIISYSDSFHQISDQDEDELTKSLSFQGLAQFLTSFKDQENSRCNKLKAKFNELLQSNDGSPQLVFNNQQASSLLGGTLPIIQLNEHVEIENKKSLNDFSEEELSFIAECEMAQPASKQPTSGAGQIVDPRIALVSFLTLAADQATETHLRSQSLDDLVESIDVVAKPINWFQSSDLPDHDSQIDQLVFELNHVPGALNPDALDGSSSKPTLAELAYLSVKSEESQSDQRQLKMVWRFEYRSNSNWYESYVDATSPGVIPMVVDWTKDFRPTSEVAPTYSEHLALQALLAERLDGSFPPAQSTSRRLSPDSETELDLPILEEGATDEARFGSYRVYPWSVNDPSQGKREIVESPSDPVASPLGWHTIPPTHRASKQLDISQLTSGWSPHVSQHGLRATDSRGNNVYAQENWEGLDNWESNHRPNGTEDLKFHFRLGWNHTHSPEEETHIDPKRYADAAISELFFTCNEFHDLTYRYGFDEEAGNFQEYNFDRGGKGGDGVIANAQDGSGYNNANFATPPDGRHGRMRMYIWNGDEPWRDGDLEAGIVIHEYSHGVSTRLTGGPANSGCLGWGEAGGMGEGWGDFFATLIRMHKSKPVDFTMGEWASGTKGGIRKYKYSLDNKINPETYKSLDKPGYWGVHAMGEVWAEMLYTVAEELIAKHGFQDSLFPPSSEESDEGDFYKISAVTGKKVPKRGNTLIFQLVIDGMKLQPCRPGFFEARDAILEADSILTGAENHCEIWKGFSKRGLGPKAAVRGSTPWGGGVRTDDFSLPHGVCEN